MSQLLVKEKEVVIPGESLADGMDYLPGRGTYRRGESIVAKMLGLMNVNGRAISLIPLAGVYKPKTGDKIIGQVFDITMGGWLVNINSAYTAMLPLKDASSKFIRKGEDLSKFFDVGDYIKAQITNVTSQNVIDLSMREPGLNKLRGGVVLKITPSKVPRLIGKAGSMVVMIKDKTGCNIAIGQNGLVWISGPNHKSELLAAEAVRKIDRESHLGGLTERMEKFLGDKNV